MDPFFSESIIKEIAMRSVHEELKLKTSVIPTENEVKEPMHGNVKAYISIETVGLSSH